METVPSASIYEVWPRTRPEDEVSRDQLAFLIERIRKKRNERNKREKKIRRRKKRKRRKEEKRKEEKKLTQPIFPPSP